MFRTSKEQVGAAGGDQGGQGEAAEDRRCAQDRSDDDPTSHRERRHISLPLIAWEHQEK